MFHTDITFALALIALVLAAYLVLLAKVHTDVSAIPCTLIGYAVIVIALVVLLFSGFSMVNKTMMGYEMHTQMMQVRHSQMMSDMMPMHLQRERMMRILEEHQMPMHGKTPLKVHTKTIKK